MVNILLKAGAVPNQVSTQNGDFPLLVAAQNGHVEAVVALIEGGANPDQAHAEDGRIPLISAAFHGHTAVVKALLNAGAVPDISDAQSGAFPMLMAAQNGHAKVVSALLNGGADPDKVHPQSGVFPMLMAAQNGHAKVVSALLNGGADSDKVHADGTFPLLMAAQQGHAAVVAALIAAGASLDQVDTEDGNFPLLQAANNGHSAVVTALLEAGARPNQVNIRDGRFPLLSAAHHGHAAVVEALLDAGALPDQVSGNIGAFPLLMAAQSGHDTVVKALLDAGADPNKIDTVSGTFPLLLAAQNGHAAVVLALLNGDAQPDLVDAASETSALVMAVVARRKEVLRLLLERGSSLEALHPDLRVMAEQVINGTLKPDEKYVQPAENGTEVELPRPPFPGAWETQEPTNTARERFKAVLDNIGIRRGMIKDLVSPKKLNDFGGTGTDLWYAILALELGKQTVVVDIMWWDLTAHFGAQRLFPLFPGADIAGVLVDLAGIDHQTIHWNKSAEASKALASLVVLCQRGGYALSEEDLLPLQHGASLPPLAYREEDWRPWQTGSSPEGPTVKLPWIAGGDLVWGRVVVPDNGVVATILPKHEIIVRDGPWDLPPYMADQNGNPTSFRILGGFEP